MNITPEQSDLFTRLRDHSHNKEQLITRILQLKLSGHTHAEIASQLGYSKIYIDKLHSEAKREFDRQQCS